MNKKAMQMAVDYYNKELPEADKARLQFFVSLWEALDAVDAAGATAEAYEVPDADTVKSLSESGLAIMSAAPVAIDAKALIRAMNALTNTAMENGGFPTDVVEALEHTDWERIINASPIEKAGKNPNDYLSDLADALVDDGMTEDQAYLAALIASMALRPQLEGPAEAAAKVRKKAQVYLDHQLRCPFCGTAPALARVGEGGSGDGRNKTLWCPQCSTVWEFDRVRCARCGTHNQGHLHYFNIEGDDSHRIATCDECGGYVRTRFSGEGDRAPMSYEVEDVVMAKLDAIANDPKFQSVPNERLG